MSNGKQITLEVAEDGSFSIHIEGVKGPGCEGTLAAFRDKLGAPVTEGVTNEYYEGQVVVKPAVRQGR